MAISFAPKEEKKEKKGISLPFWLIWVFLLIVILGPVIYFVFFQKIPESELIPKPETSGVTQKDLTKIENILKTLEEPLFQDLVSVVPSFSLQPPTAPPEKTGRQNPFAPVE
jgi:cytoskeletal protein RodZ